MYRKLHHKLTLVFTGIAGLILIVMSVVYLYMSEQQLNKNSYYSFLAEMNTVISNLENKDVISSEWMANISSHNKYLLAFFDNGYPLTYSKEILTDEQLSDAADAIKYFENNYDRSYTLSNYVSYHKEFPYMGTGGIPYYASFLDIPKEGGNFKGLILYPRTHILQQLHLQRLYFIILNLSGVALLFGFSFFYTKRLLTPIKEAHEKQTVFIAAASHELRTPLAVILSCISASKSANALQKEHFINTAEKESTRMSQLLSDMLMLAKADTRNFLLQTESTELDTILLDTYEAFTALAKEKQISLHILLPESSIPRCTCDKSRIRQVLAILVSNGLTYGNAGGYLKLSLSFHAPYFYLKVIDNGRGISPEAKPHIFDRFYREDSSRSDKEHFGLGLCIAKEIVDAHHGMITVTDTKGGGTSFCVTLKHRENHC